MAATSYKPIFPVSPLVGIATLTAPSAITSRANITGTTGLVQLTAASTVGKRVDTIRVQAKGTTAAGVIFIWLYNGTTSFLMAEILVTVAVPDNVTIGYVSSTDYTTMALSATEQLYVSSTISQDFNIFAYGGDYA